jgi:hypothetical protein
VCCVVDTNVATTANAINGGAPAACVVASARALQQVMTRGHLYIDAEKRIITEYRRNLSAKGQPGPGDAFLKWLLTHEWNDQQITRVPLTPKADDPEDFNELPAATDGTVYDPSDRKFLAVARAHPDHPPILQAFDSKWWGWQSALREISVNIYFLCPKEIAAKYHEKMGQ